MNTVALDACTFGKTSGRLRMALVWMCLSCASAVTAAAAATATAATVEVHDLSFTSQGVKLRGTLVYPRDGAALAAVVLVHGAGQEKRDLRLAKAFAMQGIAAFGYDKRGVGQSGGVYVGQEVGTINVARDNLTLLSRDAAAALQMLGVQPRLRALPLGFVGISQAGWIIPLAALTAPQARFMLLFSGAVETTHENVQFEYLALADPDFWDHHTHEEMTTLALPPLSGMPIFGTLEWADLDPREALAQLTIPGLWLFGGRDRKVDVDLATQRLDGLIAAGHDNYSYRLYADYDHRLGGIEADVVGPGVQWIRQVIGVAK
jgi:pimeloyl-ACP methyl ester carboxylesterase